MRFEDLPEVLIPEEVAQVFRCSLKHVYALGAKGVLPSFKVGTLVRFPRRGLEAYVEAAMRGEVHAS